MKPNENALTKSTQAITHQTLKRDLLDESGGPQHHVMWVDGVGGYLLVELDEAMIGQALPSSKVDIAIVGDLSRLAAAVRRSGGDYLLQPLQASALNGQEIDRPKLLSSGDELQFGKSVKLNFYKPSPLSSTARLAMKSLHRFKPHVDGVLMLADSCILGPSAASHVHCPEWKGELLLFRKGDSWVFRTLDVVTVDGREAQGEIPMVPGMRMQGEDFSLSIE